MEECQLQARQRNGLIRVLSYDETSIAVWFFLIGMYDANLEDVSEADRRTRYVEIVAGVSFEIRLRM